MNNTDANARANVAKRKYRSMEDASSGTGNSTSMAYVPGSFNLVEIYRPSGKDKEADSVAGSHFAPVHRYKLGALFPLPTKSDGL